MDDISVIIRVRNEENWLGHSIQSILDYFKHPEIIIVDNNSNDIYLKNGHWIWLLYQISFVINTPPIVFDVNKSIGTSHVFNIVFCCFVHSGFTTIIITLR